VKQVKFPLGPSFVLVADITESSVEADILRADGYKVAYVCGYSCAAWAISQPIKELTPVVSDRYGSRETGIEISMQNGDSVTLWAPLAFSESVALEILDSLCEAA
jgi:hypothetical protein